MHIMAGTNERDSSPVTTAANSTVAIIARPGKHAQAMPSAATRTTGAFGKPA